MQNYTFRIEDFPFQVLDLFTPIANRESNMRCLQLIANTIAEADDSMVPQRAIRQRLERIEFQDSEDPQAESNSILRQLEAHGLIRRQQARSEEEDRLVTFVRLTGTGRKFLTFCQSAADTETPTASNSVISGIYNDMVSLSNEKTVHPWDVLKRACDDLEEELEHEDSFADQFRDFVERCKNEINNSESAKTWFHNVMASQFVVQYLSMESSDELGYRRYLKKTASLAKKYQKPEQADLRERIAKDRFDTVNFLQKKGGVTVTMESCRAEVMRLLKRIYQIAWRRYQDAADRANDAVSDLIKRMEEYVRARLSDLQDSRTLDKLTALINYLEKGGEIPKGLIDIAKQWNVDIPSLARRRTQSKKSSQDWEIPERYEKKPKRAAPSGTDLADALVEKALAGKDSIRLADAGFTYKGAILVVYYGVYNYKVHYELEYDRRTPIIEMVKAKGMHLPEAVIRRKSR